MGERNGFVLMLVRTVFLKRKDNALRGGAAADAAFRSQSLIPHALVLGATRVMSSWRSPFVRSGRYCLVKGGRSGVNMAAVPVMAHPLHRVAVAAILFDKYKDRSLATMDAVITFYIR